MAESDKPGQGASDFRAYLRSLPDDIALARERGLPVVLELPTPPPVHVVRLMAVLGVPIEVAVNESLTALPTYCPHKTCTWSFAGSKARAAGFLDTHIRIVHKGDDPRLVAAPVKVRPVEEPQAPALDTRGNGSGTVEKPAPTGGSVEATVGVGTATDVDGTTNSGSRKRWPREKIIAAIQEWAAEHGRPPTAGDWKSKDPAGRRPTSAAVWTTMGWADAVEEAGFPRPVGGGGGPRKNSQFDASGSGPSNEVEKPEAVTASEGEPTLGPPGSASREPVPAVTEPASGSEIDHAPALSEAEVDQGLTNLATASVSLNATPLLDQLMAAEPALRAEKASLDALIASLRERRIALEEVIATIGATDAELDYIAIHGRRSVDEPDDA